MRRLSLISSLALLAALFAVLAAFASDAPEARGKLSLAWDEYESGRCEAALAYVAGVDAIEGEGGDELAEDLAWLKVECLRNVGRYDEAAKILEGDESANYEWRDGAWRYLITEWSGSATEAERYDEALEILKRGGKFLPDDRLFPGLAASTAYRKELSSEILAGKGGRLSGGGELKVVDKAQEVAEQGWVRTCPPSEEDWSADFEDCTHWMPTAVKKLRDEGKTAWLKIPPADYRKALEFEAGKAKLEPGFGGSEVIFSKDGYSWAEKLDDSRLDAAREGLGLRGGALLLVADAARRIDLQREFISWVRGNSEDVSILIEKDELVVKKARTGRVARFRLTDWVAVFGEDSYNWERLWAEVVEELGKPMRPWVCFCGKEMVLREALSSRWDGLVTSWKGEGVASVFFASCPDHWMAVTPESLKNWGVTAADAVKRASRQASETAWELSFQKDGDKGVEYFILAGTGASAIARKPALILGLMQTIEGRDMRGQTVKVWAPLSDALVLGPASLPDEVGAEGAKKALALVGQHGAWSGPLRYKATVNLSGKPEGNFSLTGVER